MQRSATTAPSSSRRSRRSSGPGRYLALRLSWAPIGATLLPAGAPSPELEAPAPAARWCCNVRLSTPSTQPRRPSPSSEALRIPATGSSGMRLTLAHSCRNDLKRSRMTENCLTLLVTATGGAEGLGAKTTFDYDGFGRLRIRREYHYHCDV